MIEPMTFEDMTFEDMTFEYRMSIANRRHHVRKDLYSQMRGLEELRQTMYKSAVERGEPEFIIDDLREKYINTHNTVKLTIEARLQYITRIGRSPDELTPEEMDLLGHIKTLKSEFMARCLGADTDRMGTDEQPSAPKLNNLENR